MNKRKIFLRPQLISPIFYNKLSIKKEIKNNFFRVTKNVYSSWNQYYSYALCSFPFLQMDWIWWPPPHRRNYWRTTFQDYEKIETSIHPRHHQPRREYNLILLKVLLTFLGLCFRTCFKLTQKNQIEFCLQKKWKGVAFEQAARTLGLINGSQTTIATQAHH